MKQLLTLRVPLGSEIMTTMRLTTGGVCALAGLGLDDSEDCKVCVTESLLLLMHAGYEVAEVSFQEEEGLRVFARGEGGRKETATGAEDEISAALLEALAEDTAIERSGGCILSIAFRFTK